MHSSVGRWVREKVAELGLANLSTLELGSFDVNGSIRGCFHGSYVGADLRAGPCVDVVCNADLLPFPAARFPVVVSTEMLEHCDRPWLALSEAARVTTSWGHVIVTARGYSEHGCFPIHDHPDDLYRFSDGSMRYLAENAGLTVRELIHDTDTNSPGWFLLARKE